MSDQDKFVGQNPISNADYWKQKDTDFFVCKNPIPSFEFKPITIIKLDSSDGREAVIDFGGDAVTFSGDIPVDEAARIFFEAVYPYFQGG